MLLALGAVSTALDALQSLTSSKPSSPQSTGFGQGATKPFDLPGNGLATGSSTPPPWSGGGSQISPATMSALLAAQSQSSAVSPKTRPLRRAETAVELLPPARAPVDGPGNPSALRMAPRAG